MSKSKNVAQLRLNKKLYHEKSSCVRWEKRLMKCLFVEIRLLCMYFIGYWQEREREREVNKQTMWEYCEHLRSTRRLIKFNIEHFFARVQVILKTIWWVRVEEKKRWGYSCALEEWTGDRVDGFNYFRID